MVSNANLDSNNEMNINAMKTFLGNTGNIIKNSGKSLNSIFNEADKDGNGSLNSNEIQSVLQDWKMDSIYDTNTVLQAIDTDGDGNISYNEIEQYGNSLGVDLSGDKSLLSTLTNIGGLGGGLGKVINSALSLFSGGDNSNEDSKSSNFLAKLKDLF